MIIGGSQRGEILLDHLDGGAYKVNSLGQGYGPCQFARRCAENVGSDRWRRVRIAVPPDEGRDTGLGNQTHPRTIIGRHGAEPRKRLVHASRRGGSESARGALESTNGRGAMGGGHGHILSAFVGFLQ